MLPMSKYCQGVLSMFACQDFGKVEYLIADMSVECWTNEHNAYVIFAAIFFILFVIGIPIAGCFILRHFMPGINFDPTMPITQFNPRAGRDFERKDRAYLLRLKLEASAVYGFMWEGLQHQGLAPYWEWSVIMSRKAAIIAIIQLLQNYEGMCLELSCLAFCFVTYVWVFSRFELTYFSTILFFGGTCSEISTNYCSYSYVCVQSASCQVSSLRSVLS